ncbi:MAG TPA: FKBP-type peptidyl-prolyl cis-trans isomerase [Opitutaceae bacterium]|nr:FKBP-type peptidyl-prolyl cis-trans isomerase [Opitutaceae bacterium]
MKKNSPPATAASTGARYWRPLALVSLAANLAFVAWLSTSKPKVAPAPAAAPVAKSAVPVAGPYAALGSFMAENNHVPRLGWSEAQFAEFLAGFRASYERRPVPIDAEAQRLQENISQRVQAMLGGIAPSNPVEEYFKILREKERVLRTASGLHYRITEVGSGPNARAGDTVEISFAARLPGGEAVAPLSRARVRSAVGDLLPGLAEGVQLLSVGGKALVYLPPELAFTEAAWPPQLPRHTPLVFFLELHDIGPAPAP